MGMYPDENGIWGILEFDFPDNLSEKEEKAILRVLKAKFDLACAEKALGLIRNPNRREWRVVTERRPPRKGESYKETRTEGFDRAREDYYGSNAQDVVISAVEM